MQAALIYQHARESRSRVLADRLDALVRAEREGRVEHEIADDR